MRSPITEKIGPTARVAKALKELGLESRFIDGPLEGGIDPATREARGLSVLEANEINGEAGQRRASDIYSRERWTSAGEKEEFFRLGKIPKWFRRLTEVDEILKRFSLLNGSEILNLENKVGVSDNINQALVDAKSIAAPTEMMRRIGIEGVLSETGSTTWIGKSAMDHIESMRIRGNVFRGAGLVGFGFDAAITAVEAFRLRSQGSPFAADSVLRHFLARNSLGVLGGMGAGFMWGLAGGSETGPGAIVPAGVGAVVGAFAGDALAKKYDEYKVNHGIGADGKEYIYTNGGWVSRETEYEPDPNSFDGPGVIANVIEKPAPASEVPGLDFHRNEQVVDMALGNPEVLDAEHLKVDGKDWMQNASGRWIHRLPYSGPQDRYEFADVATSGKLNEIAAQFRWRNEHFKEMLGREYLQTYYQNGWNKIGPLPEDVTNALHLRNERHIVDPATRITWNQGENGEFTRMVMMPGIRGIMLPRNMPANSIETERLKQLQHEVQVENAVDEGYGDIYETSRVQPDPGGNGPDSRNSVNNWGVMGMAPAMLLKLGDLFARSAITDPARVVPSLAASANASAPSTPKVKTTVHIHLDGQKIDTHTFQHDL